MFRQTCARLKSPVSSSPLGIRGSPHVGLPTHNTHNLTTTYLNYQRNSAQGCHHLESLRTRMAASTDYSYTPLDTSSGCIRLIRIHNESESDTINIQVQTFPLADCPAYVAVSYTWGDPNGPMKAISLDGRRFDVRRNLWSFLHTIVDHHGDDADQQLFWIDAICIDQSSHAERNHQVGLMRTIYLQATHVVVWLGEGDLRSDLAIDYITGRVDSGRHYESSPASPAELRLAVQELLEREYWSRVWIIQEVMLARDIVFLCGPRRFTRDQIDRIRREEKAGKLSSQESDGSHRHAAAARGEEDDSSSGRLFLAIRDTPGWLILGQRCIADTLPQDARRFPLLTLLNSFGSQQSTDVKDRVYGLLGLATEKNSIRVDYGVSEEDVYVDVLQAVLENSESPSAGELIRIENILHRVLRLSRDLRSRWQREIEIQPLVEDLRQRVLDKPIPPSIKDVASTHYAQNRPDKVLELYMDRLGQRHPATLEVMESIASMYQQQRRLSDAEELWARFLKASKDALRAGHPPTLKVFESLKSAYRESGKHRELFQITRELLGQEHPETISALETLTTQYGEPGPQSYELFKTLRELVGVDHPRTVRVLGLLKSPFIGPGREHELFTLLAELLGPEHPETIDAFKPLLSPSRKPSQYADLLKDLESLVGAEHPFTIDASQAFRSAYRQKELCTGHIQES